MKSFATLPAAERALYWRNHAERAGVPEFIAEKDFWVCWLLRHIFATPELGAQCVFKGGTSLSKVFGAIHRFSEDIDLALTPASLGWEEADLDNAPSHSQRRKRNAQLQADCSSAVETRFMPALETVVTAALGPRPETGHWLSFEQDAASRSPVILFPYPRAVAPGSYIPPLVKMEFGSLTDQRPTGTHTITPLIARLAPDAFDDFHAEVCALEIERTFWEKATILHAEYHRPTDQPIRDRFARHYSDFAALWQHPGGRAAAARVDLLERVRLHKSRFFASSWARYETAVPGTLRLVPPDARIPELRRDYAVMEPMFLSPPPEFDTVLATLREAEDTINAT
ncbi:nucleotidyl transferase AbiEii/AbiGii toxin family protein [Haloferula sp. A504]|uniref:nucleotidyl transferase AbiEii/AbiGii toxin family protein n=1 Tax=Haloferula sp. A504 TaxID=3373601 RepID=UPI0031C86BF9|nr:nucleotidyl transferase AbiEii/AbiGii toxin family protein [Verrucomicrobiaceae bacterium E54]